MSDRKPTPDVMGAILGPQTTMVPVGKIILNGGTQMRAELDAHTVDEYSEKFEEQGDWGSFPPVVLFNDGKDYWIADGFHRIEAWRRSISHRTDDDTRSIPADVRAGTRRDAVLFAASANANHGLRRTNADKRRSVEVLLRDEEWSTWSNHEIARRCAVDEKTVRNIREQLEVTTEVPQSTQRTGADGRTINTANIGSKAWSISPKLRAEIEANSPQQAPAASTNNTHYQYTAETPVETKPLIVPEDWRMQNMIEQLAREEDLNLWPMDEDWLIGRLATLAFRNGWQVTDGFVKEQLEVSRRAIDEENKRNAKLEHARQVAAEAERQMLAEEEASVAVVPAAPTLRSFGAVELSAYITDWISGSASNTDSLLAMNSSWQIANGVLPTWLRNDGIKCSNVDLIMAVRSVQDALANQLPAAEADAILNPVPVSQRADYDSDEWYTPKEYIDAARTVMGGIDLDPATCEMAQTVVQADNYLTKVENGLAMTWICERVWLNPPYSNPEAWISKLVAQYEGKQHVKQACVLVNNATETAWFQMLLTRYPVCFPNRRLAYWRYDHEGVTARQGQAVFYLGTNVAQFAKTFGEFGPVLRRMA